MNNQPPKTPKFSGSLIQQITRKFVLLSLISLLGIVNSIALSSIFMSKKMEWTLAQISEQKIGTFKLFFERLTTDVLRNRILPQTATQPQKEQILRKIRWRNPAILDVFLVNKNGTIIAQSSRSLRPKLTKIEQQPWLSKLQDGTQIWFGLVKYDLNSFSVTMAVKLTNELGLPYKNINLVAHIDLTELWRELVDTKIGSINIYVTDHTQTPARIIVHRDIRLLNTPINSYHQHNLKLEQLTVEKSVNQQLVVAYHQSFNLFFSNQWIKSLNNLVWIVTIEQPLSEALIPFIPLLLTLTLILIAVIIAIIDNVKFVKNCVIKPIILLHKAVINLNNNQFERPVEINTNDEFGALANAFNQMMKQLKESFETLETRVKERTMELQNANRAKREFLSKMNHELRTPLNVIIGYAEQLYQDTSLPTSQKKQLEIINRSSEHLLSLINEILDISKIEAGQIDLQENTFDLYQLLTELKDVFALPAQAKNINIVLENQLIHQFHYIYADENKLRQVLINLLNNAVKFTQIGTITLRAKSLENQSLVKQTSPESSIIQLQVEDTGQGIAPEEIDKLFRAFEQTETGRSLFTGTGLGLYICHQFIELMGGKITVTSHLNIGTIFTIELPIKLKTAEAILPQKTVNKVIGLAPNQPQYRILVVDDHLESRNLLLNLMSSVGLSVQGAKNGQEAIDLWQRWQPHLIWIDLEMPILDGCEATRRIKQTTNTPIPYIIALTADASASKRQIALSCGCDDFVSKPFQAAIIWKKMTQYLGLQYIDEQSETKVDSSPNHPHQQYILTPNAFNQVSQEWLEQLYQASLHLQGKQVLWLIEQISQSHPMLAQSLKELAQTYRFDTITEHIEQYHREIL